jgi:hypothetical protein
MGKSVLIYVALTNVAGLGTTNSVTLGDEGVLQQ